MLPNRYTEIFAHDIIDYPTELLLNGIYATFDLNEAVRRLRENRITHEQWVQFYDNMYTRKTQQIGALSVPPRDKLRLRKLFVEYMHAYYIYWSLKVNKYS